MQDRALVEGCWRVGSGFGWERRLDRRFGPKSRAGFAFRTKIQRLYLKAVWNPGGLCAMAGSNSYLERKFLAALWTLD